MKGVFYGIGVGPGDPELLTLKAVRTIKECGVIAVPVHGDEIRIARRIAKEHLVGKSFLLLDLPATRNADELQKKRGEAADKVCEMLDMDVSVGFLTLGDPAIYSAYIYLQRIVAGRGYTAKTVPGVPSFCAAAAILGEPLCEGGETLHIIPALHGGIEASLSFPGTKVLVQSGKTLAEAIIPIDKCKHFAAIVERVGTPDEGVICDAVPGDADAGYFGVAVVKEDILETAKHVIMQLPAF